MSLGDVSFALLTVHLFCGLFLVLQNVVLLCGPYTTDSTAFGENWHALHRCVR
jgi:hypothetical protein